MAAKKRQILTIAGIITIILQLLIAFSVVVILFSRVNNSMPKYKVIMTNIPLKPFAGVITELQFTILNEINNQTIHWNELAVDAKRKIHIVIAGEDMDVFGHIHPEDFTNISDNSSIDVYSVYFTFPRAGRYLVFAEFVPLDQMNDFQQIVPITVYGSPVMNSTEIFDFNTDLTYRYYIMNEIQSFDQPYILSDALVLNSANGTADTYRCVASFNNNQIIHAGECVLLSFTFYNGTYPSQALEDLTPYLEHPMHLTAVHQNLTIMAHFHGFITMDNRPVKPDCSTMTMTMSMSHFGPTIYSSFLFSKPGIYRVFAQTSQGNLMLAPGFLLQVQP